MIVPRVQLTDAVSISPRSTKQISSALEGFDAASNYMGKQYKHYFSGLIYGPTCPITREKSSSSQTPGSGVMSLPSRILHNMAQKDLDVQT